MPPRQIWRRFQTFKIFVDQKVTLKIENGDITDVLNTVFKNTKLSYAIQGRQIIVNIAANPPTAKKAMPKEDIESEQNQISGVVSDNNGMPLPGANVVEKGTSNGTQTDFDGKFSLMVGFHHWLVFIDGWFSFMVGFR